MGPFDSAMSIASLIFGPIFAAIFILCGVVGAIVAGRFRLIAMLCLVFGVLGVVAWYLCFVFPYPPTGVTSSWMMAGYELTDPGGKSLAGDAALAGYDRPRRFGEFVYRTEGDPDKVWTGASIGKVRVLGQISLLLVAIGLGGVFGLAVFSPKPKD